MPETTIPRVIHRIWLGGAVPEEFAAYGRRWRELNPGWEIRDWVDGDLDWLRNRDLLSLLGPTAYAAHADVARYEILLRHGGLYVDMDVEPVRPLGELLDGHRLVLAEQHPSSICNGVMAAVPGHAFFARLVDRLPEAVRARSGAKVSELTGPGFVRREWRRVPEQLRSAPEVAVLPRTAFCPYSWHQEQLTGRAAEGSIGIHHWQRSWAPTRARPGRLLGAAKRLHRPVSPRESSDAERRTSSPGVLRVADVVLIAPVDGRPDVVALDGNDLTRVGDALIGFPQERGPLGAVEALRQGDVFLHLGAGTSLAALAAARRVGFTGRVVVAAADRWAHIGIVRSFQLYREAGGRVTVESHAAVDVASAIGSALDEVEVALVRIEPSPDQAEHLRAVASAFDTRNGGTWDEVEQALRALPVRPDDAILAAIHSDRVEDLRLRPPGSADARPVGW